MVLDQLLVTGQVSHCTGEDGASVCPIASCLVFGVDHTINSFYQQKIGYLAYLGTILGRFTRERAIIYTVSCDCAFCTMWELTIGVDVVCLYFVRFFYLIVN